VAPSALTEILVNAPVSLAAAILRAARVGAI
jgi:hypothetical protein